MSSQQSTTSKHFPSYRLAVSDFDGTIARTFEPSPNGVDIESASRQAVQTILGDNVVKEYDRQHGLKNRAPDELILDLIPATPKEEQARIIDEFKKLRLDYTRQELGARFPNGDVWPRPVPGYLEFYNSLEGTNVTHIILSSGHNEDIKVIYEEVWGLAAPIIIASESLASLTNERGLDQAPFKPAALLMEFVWDEWRNVSGEKTISNESLRDLTLYIGDDSEKDGQLATNSGVDFVHLDGTATEQQNAWITYRHKLGITTHQSAS